MARLDILRALRHFCLECQGDDAAEVQRCTDSTCALWPWRQGGKDRETKTATLQTMTAGLAEIAMTAEAADMGPAEETGAQGAALPLSSQPLTPAMRARRAHEALRAIRRHCLTCAGNRVEVRHCSAREHCVLWSLRFGVRPETYRAVRRRFAAPKALTLF